MKLALFSAIAILCIVFVFGIQTASAQTENTVKLIGCVAGDGSEQNPWKLAGVVIPPAPTAAAPAGGGGRGGGGGGAPPAAGAGGGGAGRGGAPAGGGQAPAGGGAAGGGARGGGGGARGGGGGAAAPVAAPVMPPPVDLRLTAVDMMPWRGMKAEVEGTLGPRPGSGLQEFKVVFARSVQGVCP